MFDKVVQKLNANYEDNWDVIPNYFVDQDPYEWRNVENKTNLNPLYKKQKNPLLFFNVTVYWNVMEPV